MPKCHCKTTLKKKKVRKGRKGVYQCPKCGCTYALSLVIMSNECSRKVVSARQSTNQSLADLRKKKKRRKKRGRPKGS